MRVDSTFDATHKELGGLCPKPFFIERNFPGPNGTALTGNDGCKYSIITFPI